VALVVMCVCGHHDVVCQLLVAILCEVMFWLMLMVELVLLLGCAGI